VLSIETMREDQSSCSASAATSSANGFVTADRARRRRESGARGARHLKPSDLGERDALREAAVTRTPGVGPKVAGASSPIEGQGAGLHDIDLAGASPVRSTIRAAPVKMISALVNLDYGPPRASQRIAGAASRKTPRPRNSFDWD
jgi:hypothetical protein